MEKITMNGEKLKALHALDLTHSMHHRVMLYPDEAIVFFE